ATKEHLDLIIPKLRRRLMYVHLAHNDGTFPNHLPAGGGAIDFPAVFRSLNAIGYSGYVNVDYGGVPADQILADVGRGREYFATCGTDVASCARQKRSMPCLKVPYLNRLLDVEIPDANLVFDESPRNVTPTPDFDGTLRAALSRPIGTRPLRDLVKAKEKVII